jgi:hypothetical protein
MMVQRLSLIAVLLGAGPLFAGVNTTSLKIKVYGAWVSASGDCSNPVEILNSTAGTEMDFQQSPTIAQKAIPASTYKCLVLKIDDVIKFTPSAAIGPCVAGTEYLLDICQPQNTVRTSKDVTTSAIINCTSSLTTPDKVFIYVSRNSACVGDGTTTGGCTQYIQAFLPPVQPNDTTNGIKLQNDITISVDTTGSFVINTDGKVVNNGGQCGMDPPLFGYKAN